MVDDFDLDDDWEDIADEDFGVSDEVKVFVPEVPETTETSADGYIEDSDGFDEAGFDEVVFTEGETEVSDDFEIDFSMFEVDEDKKRAREAEKAARKNKKKKK